MSTTTTIDAVLAWVDGSDPKHFEKKNRYLKHLNKPYSKNYDASRYSSNYEINYAVLSLLKYASFLRHIYIVTDDQTPEIMEDVKANYPDQYKKIKIVDHKEIFRGFEDNLPSFNSRSIANLTYRIKGLSSRYIYLNDDFLLIKPCSEMTFFNGERPVLRGKWNLNSFYRMWWNSLKMQFYKISKINKEPRASFHLSQWVAAKAMGYKLRYWTNSHSPHPINKEAVEELFKENPNLLLNNIKPQFRNRSQFSSIALYNHLEKSKYKNKNTATDKEVYIKKRAQKNYIKNKIAYLESSKCTENFLCIQDLDQLNKEELTDLYTYLDNHVGKVNRNE